MTNEKQKRRSRSASWERLSFSQKIKALKSCAVSEREAREIVTPDFRDLPEEVREGLTPGKLSEIEYN